MDQKDRDEVLCIDDDQELAQVRCQVLERSGFQVRPANVSDAITLAEQTDFTAFVLGAFVPKSLDIELHRLHPDAKIIRLEPGSAGGDLVDAVHSQVPSAKGSMSTKR